MKKILIPSLAIFLLTAAGAMAQSTTQTVEDKAEQAMVSTETSVEKAAKKTGDMAKKAADTTVKRVKKAGKDVVNSDIYKKIETELGKPFTPEQQKKYAEAWKAAQQKARATEKEFSDKVSEITGVAKTKTKKIVKDAGL